MRMRDFRWACLLVGLYGCGPAPDADSGEGTENGASGGSDSAANTSPGGDDVVDDDAGTGSTGGSSDGATQTDDGDPTGSTGEPAGGYEAPLDWQPCATFTGGTDNDAQCVSVPVPVDWTDPAGPTLEIFVKRIGPVSGDKQLWMLMGGPGGSARGYESSASIYSDADPGLTVYLLDHRGTGRSTFLGCPEQEAPGSDDGRTITAAETPACVAHLEETHGDTLPHFNTTNASGDLGWLVEQVRGDQAVHIYGSSYGTYWAQRYLQLFGDQPDSVTLLGIVEPAFTFTTSDPEFNAAGVALLASCAADPFCASVMGDDPATTLSDTYAAVAAGQCAAAGLDRDTLRTYFSSLLSWAGNERARIPATVHRINRCNPGDIAALQTAAPQMASPLSGLLDDPLLSVVINRYVSLSEMWGAPFPTERDIEDWDDHLLFSLASSSARFEVADLWPTYAAPADGDAFAHSDVPMLMLNGEFDPNSPLAAATAVGDHFAGANQRFFAIPGGNHTWHSPTTQGYDCAENMFFGFIQDPTAPLLDCLGDVEPIAWQGSTADAQAFFGTNDLYDLP